jgi:hypothetical protein
MRRAGVPIVVAQVGGARTGAQMPLWGAEYLGWKIKNGSAAIKADRQHRATALPDATSRTNHPARTPIRFRKLG